MSLEHESEEHLGVCGVNPVEGLVDIEVEGDWECPEPEESLMEGAERVGSFWPQLVDRWTSSTIGQGTVTHYSFLRSGLIWSVHRVM